jgi:CelD/BcsL family acetyltransferase involved in cellulose biosynthesis
MKVEICHPKELDSSQIDHWRALQSTNEGWASAFVSPGFARQMGQVRDDTRVAMVKDGGDVAAYFAFQARGSGWGQALGYGVSDQQAVIRAPGFEYCHSELLNSCGLGVWEFDHVGEGNPELHSFIESWTTGSVMDISNGYEQYLDDANLRSTKLFKTSRSKQRRLASAYGELTFELDSSDKSAFKSLLEWKSQQYKRTGRTDRFSIGWIRSLIESLLDADSPDCKGLLSVLRAGDRVVAVHFGLRAGDQLGLWFPAYDTEFSKYSPGTIFHLRLAEEAAKAGIRQLDLGKGSESYKSELRTHEYPIGEGALSRFSMAATMSWMRRVPKRSVNDFVVRNERLRTAARSTLRKLGELRSSA